ncbi:MAG: tyrosine-type recombinase/integrase [Bacillota bacterium]
MEKYIKDFINDAKTFNLYSDNTIKSYSVAYKQFNRRFDFDISNITRQNIKNFINGLQPISQATLNLKISALSAFFDFLVEKGVIENNPTENIKLKAPKITENQPLTQKDIDLLIDKVNTRNTIRDRAILALLFASGMRINELTNLNKENIKIENGNSIIKIKNAKNDKERIVFIPQKYYSYLDMYLSLRNDNKKAIFISERGSRINDDTIRKMIKNITKEFDKNVTPHDFRKAYATFLLNKDIPMSIISDNLGHSDSRVTEKIYAKYSKSNRAEKTLGAFD